ncbi:MULTISPECIES: S9 family peptidase [unclassified Mumia]|uniref:alpha/beta hydrolase family protein n=1 Tax=unclassified Mumia TaxID=2621872 RepID=UPI002106CDB6|nr:MULTISPECIES: alpha/beta fold hydrolase [unclassified Mumia]MDD9349083.1 alpha/beta fold hydrolase [Mumia sp.]
MQGAPVRTVVAAVALVAAAACTSERTTGDTAPSSPPGATTEPVSEPSVSEPSAADRPDPTATPALPAAGSPVSLPALMAKEYDGRALRLGETLATTEAYTRRAVTYRSGDLRISGILVVPRGRGPFPVLILAHGYIDPAVYTSGRGMTREQDYLARAGYAVLHVDYRNHAGSDDDPTAERDLRLGYTEDVINAVLAVRRSGDPRLDGDRVGLVGRSMGGGVVQNVLVTKPGLVDAAVVFASVSSDTVDNYERWTAAERPEVARQIVRRHGSPEDAPGFWKQVSPRTYVDRVTEPLLMLHGTADDTCPPRWSEQTAAAFERAGKDVELVTYAGEGHAFGPQWPQSMRRTVRFLRTEMG